MSTAAHQRQLDEHLLQAFTAALNRRQNKSKILAALDASLPLDTLFISHCAATDSDGHSETITDDDNDNDSREERPDKFLRFCYEVTKLLTHDDDDSTKYSGTRSVLGRYQMAQLVSSQMQQLGYTVPSTRPFSNSDGTSLIKVGVFSQLLYPTVVDIRQVLEFLLRQVSSDNARIYAQQTLRGKSVIVEEEEAVTVGESVSTTIEEQVETMSLTVTPEPALSEPRVITAPTLSKKIYTKQDLDSLIRENKGLEEQLNALKVHWDGYKQPYVSKREALLAQLADIAQQKTEAKRRKQLIKLKRQELQQLKSQLEQLPLNADGITRMQYLSKIKDLVASTRKQREESIRVYADVHGMGEHRSSLQTKVDLALDAALTQTSPTYLLQPSPLHVTTTIKLQTIHSLFKDFIQALEDLGRIKGQRRVVDERVAVLEKDELVVQRWTRAMNDLNRLKQR